MISTSFILSTGLKKWMPTNFCGLALALARPLMGRVEVLEAKKPPGASIGSASRVTRAFSSRFSNTASMMRSQPSRSRARSVAWMRSSSRRWSSAASLPLSPRACVIFTL